MGKFSARVRPGAVANGSGSKNDTCIAEDSVGRQVLRLFHAHGLVRTFPPLVDIEVRGHYEGTGTLLSALELAHAHLICDIWPGASASSLVRPSCAQASLQRPRARYRRTSGLVRVQMQIGDFRCPCRALVLLHLLPSCSSGRNQNQKYISPPPHRGGGAPGEGGGQSPAPEPPKGH